MYSGPLKKLQQGNEIFAYMKGWGYIGYEKVKGPALMIKDFFIDNGKITPLDVQLVAPNTSDNKDDPDLSEWAVPISREKTFTRDSPRHFKGIFANQNIVCKMRHQQTLDFLKHEVGAE